MPKCKKERKKFDSINVIPFIDIMLVLLVMVLTTATFIKQGIIPVDLPSASAKASNKKQKEVSILVDATGAIYFQKKKMTLQELEVALQNTPKEDIVVLESDKSSKFQDFVAVMDILKKLGHEELYIVTKEK